MLRRGAPRCAIVRRRHFGASATTLTERIEAALGGETHGVHSVSHLRLRDEWRRRSKLWNLRDLRRNVLDRPAALWQTLRHGAYCTAVTAPFMLLHSGNLSEIAELQAHPELAAFVDQGHVSVEFLCANSETLMGATGFLATALFLILSFRVNRSIKRWAEGRQLFGQVLADTRALTDSAQAYVLPQYRTTAVSVGILSYTFARSLELHLRQADDETVAHVLRPAVGCDARLAMLLASPHRPFFVAEGLTKMLAEAHNRGEMHGIRSLVACQDRVVSLVHAVEGLHRVQSTPEPFAFQKHLRFTIMVWLGILPLALLPSLMWATPLLSTTIGLVVLKLEDVAIEITNPFGYEHSSVHVCILNDQLQKRLRSNLFAYAAEASEKDI